MSQKWSRKKSRLPLAGLLFMLALAVTFMVLYNERSIQQIHHNTNHEQDLRETSTFTSFVHPNLPPRNHPGTQFIIILILFWTDGNFLIHAVFVWFCLIKIKWQRRFWIDSADATPRMSTVARKLDGLTIRLLKYLLQMRRTLAMSSLGNGSLIILLPTHYTRNLTVLTCLTS